jgi:hypothetical protein
MQHVTVGPFKAPPSQCHLAWNHTVTSGVVAFHDYVESGGDLPQLTEAVKGLIEANKGAIAETCPLPDNAITLIRKG